MIGCYNRGGKCLQRGTDCFLKKADYISSLNVKSGGVCYAVSIQAIGFSWKHVRERVTHLHIVSRLRMGGAIPPLHTIYPHGVYVGTIPPLTCT